MVNASFVFGMDEDDESVFERTAAWAIEQGVETATFHILTPYPGTALYHRMLAQGRITSHNWELYDTRHVVFQPARLTPAALEAGYWQAYQQFYRWSAIFQGAWSKPDLPGRLRHLAYAGGWKKFEPLWDLVIRLKRVSNFLPLLERLLEGKAHTSDLSGFENPQGLISEQAFAGAEIKLDSQRSGIAGNVID